MCTRNPPRHGHFKAGKMRYTGILNWGEGGRCLGFQGKECTSQGDRKSRSLVMRHLPYHRDESLRENLFINNLYSGKDLQFRFFCMVKGRTNLSPETMGAFKYFQLRIIHMPKWDILGGDGSDCPEPLHQTPAPLLFSLSMHFFILKSQTPTPFSLVQDESYTSFCLPDFGMSMCMWTLQIYAMVTSRANPLSPLFSISEHLEVTQVLKNKYT